MPGRKIPGALRRQQILTGALQVAEREGIGAVTLRAVGRQAGLSHALVLFHFKTREALERAVLASVLATVLAVPVAPAALTALEGLRALVRAEMERLRLDPARMRLLMDCWALGALHPDLREQVTAAWAAYREGFRQAIEAALAERGPASGGATAASLAALTASVVSHGVFQELIDPDGFRAADYGSAADTVLDGVFGKGS